MYEKLWKGGIDLAEVILLVLAVCTDSFATSITYGIGKIRIKFLSSLTVAAIGTAVLWCALFASEIVKKAVSPEAARIGGGALLVALGLFMIFGKSIKKLYENCRKDGKKRFFSKECINKTTVVSVFFDETKADMDNSKTLSVKEAAVLGAALSADSFLTGISAGAGFSEPQKTAAVILCFLSGIAAIAGGEKIGRLIALKINSRLDLSALGGLLITVLGISQLAKPYF